ncbi:MAG: right-handed parallel beta-helix repeat-containing protein, partial [Promethearchaeota archaeon]
MKSRNSRVIVFGFLVILFMLTMDIAYNPATLTNEKNPVGAYRENILAASAVDSDMDGWSDYDELNTIFTDPFDPGPFYIDGDAELAAIAAWHGWDGDGTEDYPYIIENYAIDVNDADVSCIKILNIASTYFIIRDCTVTGASGPYAEQIIPFEHAHAGIWLSNVQYAEVTNNLVFGNLYGIRVDYSYAVVIEQNTCYSNIWEGIAVLLDSTQCIVRDNYCYNSFNPD